MFTGLIEGLGKVVRLVHKGPDARIIIAPPWDIKEARLGESVAVNGACLTVDEIMGSDWAMDISQESLNKTTLGSLKPGLEVNLERALPLGGRLDGHLVSGHVDCLGQVQRINRVGSSLAWAIALPAEHLELVAPKGSIAVNGVSLTVNQVTETFFTLNLIPHTLSKTTLRLVKQGDYVNIETDLIAKYLSKIIEKRKTSARESSGLEFADLARMGF